MIPPKETKKAPITDPKERMTDELSDKELRTMFLQKFNEVVGHTDN